MVFVSNWSFVVMLVATWLEFTNIRLVNAHKYSESSNIIKRPTKPSEVERMYNNSFISDIKFTFGDKKSGEVFYAHKFVLAMSSPVFNEMFYSKTETEKPIKTIHFPDQNTETLAGFFSFIYKEECPKDFEKDLEVLRLIKKYEIVSFDSACSHSFQRNTELQKACKLLDKFLEMKAEALAEICMDKIDLYADEYFASEYFLSIKQSTLNILLDRDTLWYNETDLFKAVLKWADHQCSLQNLITTQEDRRKVVGNAIYSIRFLLMNQSEFATHVLPTDILDDHEMVEIIKWMAGEQVPYLAWDIAKLRNKRLPEWLPATTKSKSWTHYFGVFVFGYLIPSIKYLIFGIGICFCFAIGQDKWKHGF
ncbi:BTB POZ domain-containing 6-like [Paramuricea clavata]|uniref:BTB POZ domain-containing 6-like n=1 Tax=Paramuricea clavata TaxID=317549 RepID=A0A6S7JSK6_PARCT|nr:BTB POZ domain-containing 6-like [Paramuricea clavata]